MATDDWAALRTAPWDGKYGPLVTLLNRVLEPRGWDVPDAEYVGDGVAQVRLVIMEVSRIGIAHATPSGPLGYQAAYEAALCHAARQFGIGASGSGAAEGAKPEPRWEPPARADAGTHPIAPPKPEVELHSFATQKPGGTGSPARDPRQTLAASQPVVLPATEAQLKAIFAIGRGAVGMSDDEIEAASVQMFGVPPPQLNRRQASQLIDAIKGEAKQG